MSYMDNARSFVPRKITTCNTTTFRYEGGGISQEEAVNSGATPDLWAPWLPSKPLALEHCGELLNFQ